MRTFLFLFAALLSGILPGVQAVEPVVVNTGSLSMVFTVAEDGKVVFNYFGDKIEDTGSFAGRKYKEQPDNGTGYAPVLYPAYGGRYFLHPALKLTHMDGVQTTELIYVNHTSKLLDSNREEIVIHMKDPLYPVFVDVIFTTFRKENVITQSVEITHKEKKGIVVEQIASGYLPLHADDYYLTHFHGTWAAEMQLVEEKLTAGSKRVESRKGVRATQSANPSFLVSLNGPAQEDTGEVYGGSLAWSGNYLLSFEKDECGILHVVTGMNDFASAYHLAVGKVLKTPEMVWTYSSSGQGQISRNLHDWSRKYALAHGDQLLPVVLNSWEGAYFNFDEQTITDMIDAAAGFGVELFVLDDGWFGSKYPRNSDNAGLGDWHENRTKLPRGIDYLASYAVNKGLQFGIWIEPEMVNPDSELAKKHPEWIVKSGKRDIIPMRTQWILDLSNPAVQDFVVNVFDGVMALSPHISYIKWDANRHVDNFGSDYLSSSEQTHFWIEYVKGLYKVYDRIRAKHPDVLIQLCSSGGGRLDFGALTYHDEVWPSDNTNSLDRVFIQYGTNLFFPAMATAAHVSTSPNHQTGMLAPLKFRFDVAMSGRLGMELQPKDLTPEELPFAKQAVENYKRIRPLVQLGDLFRLKSPYHENGWASHMYVAKDQKEAVFFAYSLKYHGRTAFFETKLKGLDPAKKYRIQELNRMGWPGFYGDGQVFTGEYLMKAGISLTIGNSFDSTVLLLTEE
ncbi:MAG: alpha-galactosidase [Tannerellaceae bacterium]|nr:alpha-galactosidase [Tannerellaceae bacterium]